MITSQRGVALVVALTLLLFASIIAISAVRYSALALRVAANTDYRLTAFQNAQSVIDATIAEPANTPVNDVTGYVACTTGAACSGTPATITLPDSFMASEVAANKVKVRVKRLGGSKLCPRAFGNETDFYCAQFGIESTYDPAAVGEITGRGTSYINEGLIVPYN